MPTSTTATTLPGQTRPEYYDPAYGGLPSVPDPLASLRSALSGNLASLADITGLTSGLAAANAQAAQGAVGLNLPNYGQMLTQSSGNILANLRGEVAPDVVNLLAQQAAERGVGFGGWNPNANAALLRALGTTSMQRQDLGNTQLTEAIGRTPTGPAVDATQFLVTPQALQDWSWLANTIAAAPIPEYAAREEEAAAMRGMRAAQAAAQPARTWWSGREGAAGSPTYQPTNFLLDSPFS